MLGSVFPEALPPWSEPPEALPPWSVPPEELPLGSVPPEELPLGSVLPEELPLGSVPPEELPLGSVPPEELPPWSVPPEELPPWSALPAGSEAGVEDGSERSEVPDSSNGRAWVSSWGSEGSSVWLSREMPAKPEDSFAATSHRGCSSLPTTITRSPGWAVPAASSRPSSVWEYSRVLPV